MREHCWILIGECRAGVWRFRRRQPVTGTVAAVDFDWRWALEREERHGDVAGFWHTHPPGAGTAPSARDVRTLRAWCSALGKPLVCVIAGGRQLAAYVFDGDASLGVALAAPRRVARGAWEVRS